MEYITPTLTMVGGASNLVLGAIVTNPSTESPRLQDEFASLEAEW
jgi:hypothetical protein